MKPDILRWIGTLKKFFLAGSAVLLAAAMGFAVAALQGDGLFFLASGACIAGFTVLLVLYLAKVKYALVYELVYAEGVVNVKVRGGAYTFAPEELEKVLYDGMRFVLYFYKDGSQERFTLLRRIPFDRFRREQFAAAEIAAFFPQLPQEAV